MNLQELLWFHEKLAEKTDRILANQVKIMDDIAAAVAAMNEAAAVLQAHVAAAAEPVDLSGLRGATAALNQALHPAEPSPAEVTVPDPPGDLVQNLDISSPNFGGISVHEAQPGGF